MITSLPKKLSNNFLEDFQIGSHEAVDDSLLKECFCDTSAINSFLKNNKDILIGSKGAGKTAVFTLLKNKHIKFTQKKTTKQLIVPIDQDIEYQSIKNILNKSIKSIIDDKTMHYRYIWEIYILYRLTLLLLEDLNNIPTSLKEQMNQLKDNFSNQKPMNILNLISSSKNTLGFKLDATNPIMPMPDFYISSEPIEEIKDKTINIDTFNIDKYKNELNTFLDSKNITTYIIIDQLDDFVAKENYIIQKEILESLIQVTKTYFKYDFIKVKLFLRKDLFYKLNFSQFGGYDKIESRIAVLNWTEIDIRKFLAKRILYNYARIENFTNYRVEIDENDLFVHSNHNKNNFFSNLYYKAKAYWNKRMRDSRDAREVSVNDKFNKLIITTIFPREINHYKHNGSSTKENLNEFCKTHLHLANSGVNPRIMLLFLEKVFLCAKEYYINNPDELTHSLKLNERCEYPLIHRNFISIAYSSLQDTMLEILKSSITNDDWREYLSHFFYAKREQTTFSYHKLSQIFSSFDNTEELDTFLKYLANLGIFENNNSSIEYKKRNFKIPIILQKNWLLEKKN